MFSSITGQSQNLKEKILLCCSDDKTYYPCFIPGNLLNFSVDECDVYVHLFGNPYRYHNNIQWKQGRAVRPISSQRSLNLLAHIVECTTEMIFQFKLTHTQKILNVTTYFSSYTKNSPRSTQPQRMIVHVGMVCRENCLSTSKAVVVWT